MYCAEVRRTDLCPVSLSANRVILCYCSYLFYKTKGTHVSSGGWHLRKCKPMSVSHG
jgi:hypothetical protein